jgi:DNA gyrase subunit A
MMVNMGETVDTQIEKEMQSSYIDYAMSVIIGRALPEVRDGLKPAHRRILYAMYRLNNLHNQPTKKSARIVGEVIGKYHPHGDIAAYDTLVRMAQDFSINHTLVEGQGNMGSIDGDSPAAARYTEVRLTKLAEEMLEDLDKNAVPMMPNFDNTEEEPTLLPAKVPNLLLNGSSGIAVGVATNIMPHNLSEICDAVVAYLANNTITSEQLLNYIKGPDLPTGGTIFYNEALLASYLKGRGAVVIRAKTETEKIKNKEAIIVTEIPYTVNKASLVEQIANLVKEKKVIGISDLRDESGKEEGGTRSRIVIELKPDAEKEYVLNQLYKHSQLQISLPVMNIAVLGNRLLTLTLKDFVRHFVDHRTSVIKNRSAYDLKIATDRLHIAEGLLVAVQNIEQIVASIKKSKEIKEARALLMQGYALSEKQANAILDMKLGKLTGLERGSLETEKINLKSKISELEGILADAQKVLNIIKTETQYIKSTYGRERRTQIDSSAPLVIEREDLIQDDETTIILTKNNYIKRIDTKAYRQQDRGGRGVIAISLKEGDIVKQITYCRLKDHLLIISNTGRAYWLKAYMVPEEGRYGSGKAAINLVKFEDGEHAEAIINTKSFAKSFITFITAKGKIKRTEAENFSNPRANGIRALNLVPGDSLADVCLSDGNSELFIATRKGKALRFSENDIRPMGRQAAGIRGIRLNEGDNVINIISAKARDQVLSITELGYGKITELEKYRLQRRGGKGVLNIRVKEKTGYVVRALKVDNAGNLMLINSKGISISFATNEIRVTGRAASGVRLMRLDPGVKIIDAQLFEPEKTGAPPQPAQPTQHTAQP